MPVLDFGGVEARVVLQSSKSFTRSYDLRVCTFDRARAAADAVRAEGIEVDVLDTPANPRSPEALRMLISYLRRVRPDVLHSSISEANVLGLVAASFAGVRARIAEEVGVPSHSWKGRIAMAGLYRRATRIVGVSEATCRYLIDVDRAPRERVRRIYNCAHPRFFPLDRAPVQRLRGRDELRVLAVGRLHPVKNHLRLLDAVSRIERRNVSLEIIGTGPIERQTKERVESLGLSERVKLRGFQSDVRPLLLHADAFILPSISEGCSISLIEAMASGVPVLGSKAPGIEEVMGKIHATDWTFPPEDVSAMAAKLERLLDMPTDARASYAAQLQDRAYREFSPDTYMANLEALYAETLEAAGQYA
jgi:glycosyltransferase involved in cell wall biosynthesis